MKVIIYSTKDYETSYLLDANINKHELTITEQSLKLETVKLAKEHDAIVVFACDDVSEPVIQKLHEIGIKFIAIRAAGFDNVALNKAKELGIKCANVPEYSPNAIAEHAVALMLALNRKLLLASKQVHQHNFTVGNLIGFDFNNKTVGIVGTGRIGSIVAKIMHGFGCNLLGYDTEENPELIEKFNLRYVDLKTLCGQSDVITLHLPLNTDTKHLINDKMIEVMKSGVMLINTARGAIIDTEKVIKALKAGKIGYLGLDVYEKEKGVFFYDYSVEKIQDTVLNELINHPDVIITAHQAFATKEALLNLAETTFYNLNQWAQNKKSENELT